MGNGLVSPGGAAPARVARVRRRGSVRHPVAVAALIGFETSLPGIASGLSAVTGGPDTIPASAQTDASRTSRVNRAMVALASKSGSSVGPHPGAGRGTGRGMGTGGTGWLRWRLVGSFDDQPAAHGRGTSGAGRHRDSTINNTANTVGGHVNNTVDTVGDTVNNIGRHCRQHRQQRRRRLSATPSTTPSMASTTHLGGVNTTVNGLRGP